MRSVTATGNGEMHLRAARVANTLYCVGLPVGCFAFAAWLAVRGVGQSHLSTSAGGPIAAIFIGGLVLLGAYAARVTVRASRCGVSLGDSVMVIHNLTNDLTIE
jgi:hypothetical protein